MQNAKEKVKKAVTLLKNGEFELLFNKSYQVLKKSFNPNSNPTEVVCQVKPLELQSIDSCEKLIFPKTDSKPLVSIIIPVFNAWNFTYSCLKSIRSTTTEPNYEIIIADDGSTDDTIKIPQKIENIKFIKNKSGLKGFIGNVNYAAKFAEGDFLLLLNNDTQVCPNWMESLIKEMLIDESIGIVGSKLIYPNGSLQEAGGIIWNDGDGCNFGNGDNPNKFGYSYKKEVDYISGASILIRKTFWDKVGGLDERFAPAYYEDADLAFSARALGFKVVYQPESVVIHFEGISNGKSLENGIKRYQLLNKAKFVQKWKKELSAHVTQDEIFLAKDRSQERQTILVIDRYVPEFDKDAGSRTIHQYLQIFVKLGLKVLFFGENNSLNGNYGKQLQQLGIEVIYDCDLETWLKTNGRFLNFIFINRPNIALKYINSVKKFTTGKILYNVCDLHFLRDLRDFELTGNKDALNSSKYWEKREFDLMKRADFILTLSSFEQNIIKSKLPSANVLIPPVFIYPFERQNTVNSIKNKKDLLFVGGYDHKPNIDAANWLVKEILPKILKKNNDLKVILCGSNPPKEITQLQSDNCIVTGYVSDYLLNCIYSSVKLCVIPLRFGAGVKGKTIEAMYHQVPIVSTSVGLEGISGIDTILDYHDSAEDFADAILTLYNDDDALENQITNNYAFIQERFSEKVAGDFFMSLFEEY